MFPSDSECGIIRGQSTSRVLKEQISAMIRILNFQRPAANGSRQAGKMRPVEMAVCLAIIVGSTTALIAQESSDDRASAEGMVQVVPSPYSKALRNPLKGLTARVLGEQKWATLTHDYIPWNELENNESDGLDKILAYSDAKWRDLPGKNTKVIPRVYLHYSTDQEKCWPADLAKDDYSSDRFQKRVVRLIERLGLAWDNDPRVAYVEMGIFGRWGEQHSPAPTPEMQRLVAAAFARAFPHKLVSVRQAWVEFTSQPFGEYWDSFAHYDQMWSDGHAIAELNAREHRYKENYIGGEVAYDWGNCEIQPGKSPTATLAQPEHLNFVLNTIRWLHCTQLRWIADYDPASPAAEAGAELVQAALGYRFVLEKVAFTSSVPAGGLMKVELKVKNVGSAPFYYPWPVEVSLLRSDNFSVAWKRTFTNADIRQWLPGDGWTDPEWLNDPKTGERIASSEWAKHSPDWRELPRSNDLSDHFTVDVPPGRYVLAVAILDPAGMLPSLRFATANYLRGGRHPVGIVAVGGGIGGPLPRDFQFDDPASDQTLHYVR
jgi:hypothetical protein